MARSLIFLFGLTGALLFGVTSIVGGLQVEGYSHIGQYISESYATGLPNATYLQYAFMASGILLFLFGSTAPSAFPKSRAVKIGFALFAIFYGLGTSVTGLFPCDLGCPSDTIDLSISQFIHNISGFLAYTIVPFCLIGLGISFSKFEKTRRLGRLTLVCGMVALIFMLPLFASPSGPYRGLFQRILEASILLWVICTSFHVLRAKNGSDRSVRPQNDLP